MKLYHRIYGKGPPLVILHGLFGSSDNWNSLAKKFSEHFKTVICDSRNHGQSPHSGDFDQDLMSQDLKELLDDLGIDKAHIMGHSMGGKTAMLFAVQHPDRLNKLIVSDIAPRYYQPGHQEIIDALENLEVQNINSRAEAEAKFSRLLPDTVTRQFLLKSLRWKPSDDNKPARLDWKFNLESISKNLDEVGKGLPDGSYYEGPVLFVRGENSSYILKEDESLISKIFPSADIHTVAGAGHWIHADKPLEFFEIVLNYLGGASY